MNDYGSLKPMQTNPFQRGYPEEPLLVAKIPAVFRIIKYLIRNSIPGGYKLLVIARKLRLLDVLYRHKLNDRVSVDIPLYSPDDAMDQKEIDTYETDLIDTVSDCINRMSGPVVLVDCGANIGLISARLVAACPNIARVEAIEPNPHIFNVLEDNVKRLPIESKVHLAAVGSQSGMGRLVRPEYDPSDHARFMQPDPEGQVEIVRIDDLGIQANQLLAIKVDVEGNELDVFEGAAQTLAQARQFCLVFEAHPRLISRTKIDPSRVMQLINSIRPCRFFVCEQPGLIIDPSVDCFSQITPDRVYNIFCYSIDD